MAWAQPQAVYRRIGHEPISVPLHAGLQSTQNTELISRFKLHLRPSARPTTPKRRCSAAGNESPPKMAGAARRGTLMFTFSSPARANKRDIVASRERMRRWGKPISTCERKNFSFDSRLGTPGDRCEAMTSTRCLPKAQRKRYTPSHTTFLLLWPCHRIES
jgi:hypothetical protein